MAGDELPQYRLPAQWDTDFRRMDHRQIERRVAFLLPDRRADVDSFVPYIKGYTKSLRA